MMPPRYITQLTRDDLAKILAAANLEVGFGLKLESTGDAIRISLDENDLKQAIWSFNHNGGFAAARDDVDNIPLG